MSQTQLINTVVAWEWQLKNAEEKQRNLKGLPYNDMTTTSEPVQEERKSIFAQLFKWGKANQPVQKPAYEQCWESNLG